MEKKTKWLALLGQGTLDHLFHKSYIVSCFACRKASADVLLAMTYLFHYYERGRD